MYFQDLAEYGCNTVPKNVPSGKICSKLAIFGQSGVSSEIKLTLTSVFDKIFMISTLYSYHLKVVNI